MPAYVRGIGRSITKFVLISTQSPTVFYGFAAKDFDQIPGVTGTDVEPLGHKLASALAAGSLKIYRATKPKPMRVRKVINRNPNASQQEAISSFCSAERYNDAVSAGWKLITAAQSVSLTQNDRTITAIVTLTGGLKYAFPTNANDFNSFKTELGWASAGDLGQITQVEKWKIITGCRVPSPPRAKKPDSDGKATTFYDPGAEQSVTAAGWSLVKGEILSE